MRTVKNIGTKPDTIYAYFQEVKCYVILKIPGVLTEFKLKISLSMEIDTCPDYQSASGSKPCNCFAAV